MVRYSVDQLLEALRECKRKHGKITTQKLNRDDNLPSGTIYSYRFSSLADAAEKAGLDEEAKKIKENQQLRNGYTDTEIKSFIRRISSDEDEVSPKIISNTDGPSRPVVADYLDTDTLVGESVDGVDIVPHHQYKSPKKEKVDRVLQRIAERKGTVVGSDLTDTDITITDVNRIYGSIVEARESLEIQHPTSQKEVVIEQPEDYIYVIRKDGEFYVGKSETPLDRIRHHAKECDVSLERIVAVPEDRDTRDFEREMAMEIARQYNTTDVGGGK